MRALKPSVMLRFGGLLMLIRVIGYVTAQRAPICYDDGGQFPAPAATDCRSAMAFIKNSPYFSKPQKYGAYEDPPRNVPLDWPNKSCLLTIDVDDGSKTDTFALSATMPAFAALEAACIRRRKPGQGFGGYVPIGNGKFYAIMQYNPKYRGSGASEPLRGPSSGTENATNSLDTS
ncbi:MAG: hypothetical protein Q9181_004102 [Wetmoreana brouardii]